MSSRKLSDKEFDRYTRNILKKPEGMAFDKSAWMAMEQKIAQNGTSSSALSLKWLIPGILILLTTTGYFGYQNFNESKAVLEEDAFLNGESAMETVFPSDTTTSTQKPYVKSNINTASLTPSIPSSQTSTREKTVAKTATPDLINESTNSDQTQILPKGAEAEKVRAEQPEVINPEKENTIRAKETLQSASNPVADKSVTKEVMTSNAPASGLQKIKETAAVNVAELKTIQAKTIELSLAKTELPTFIPAMQKDDEGHTIHADTAAAKEEVILPFSRWALGITLAPDFSTVGELNEFTRPGTDLGFSVEYFITRRLSVTTGAILTRKLYSTTDASEYTVPAGFWRGNPAPEEIAANCKVIDIPLNLRYRLTEGKRNSLFVSAGISSYLMLNEKYEYNYDYGIGNGNQPESWEVSNENNHFFGVYNLSVGIARKVSRKISVEAEPFLKNSLGDVGWGQVRLKSTGVLFHLKYSF